MRLNSMGPLICRFFSLNAVQRKREGARGGSEGGAERESQADSAPGTEPSMGLRLDYPQIMT